MIPENTRQCPVPCSISEYLSQWKATVHSLHIDVNGLATWNIVTMTFAENLV